MRPGNWRGRLAFIGWTDTDNPFLCIATEIASTSVIPAKAGIHKNSGFRVKPGMTTQDKPYVVMYSKAARGTIQRSWCPWGFGD